MHAYLEGESSDTWHASRAAPWARRAPQAALAEMAPFCWSRLHARTMAREASDDTSRLRFNPSSGADRAHRLWIRWSTSEFSRNPLAPAIVFRYEDTMAERRTDLLRGTLDLLILKAVSLEPLHGVGISRRITQITRGAFQVSFGSLFPSLHRMEERGWVEAEWRASENSRRAKYYRLTSSGREQLKVEERDWNRVVKAMTAAVQWEA